MDISTLDRVQDATELGLDEIGRVRLRTTSPLFVDSYQENRTTGSFILVDGSTNRTVGAGLLTAAHGARGAGPSTRGEGEAMVERVPDETTGPIWVRRAVEDEAGEGLLLAEYATRMRLKNRIIVDTVTADGSVDPEAWADEVRLVLGGLRLEAEGSARRMEREASVARVTGGSAVHEHDYRASDTDNLDRRRRVYGLVARRLLGWENDPAQVAALLEAARLDAQEEIDAALTRAVSGDPVDRVEDEARLRERLRLIATVDLPALEAAVRGRSAPIPVPACPPAAAPAPARRTWLQRLLRPRG